jgi:hypothetical protein
MTPVKRSDHSSNLTRESENFWCGVKNPDAGEVRISNVGERRRARTEHECGIPSVGVLVYGLINCSRWLVCRELVRILVYSGLGLEKLIRNFKLFL